MKVLCLATLALLCLAAAVDAAGLGDACAAQADCTQDLVCDNKKCRSKLNAACDAKDKCVSNADCKDVLGQTRCKCTDNFVPNGDKTKCLKKVGQGCGDKSECLPNSQCSGGKCACAEKYLPLDNLGLCFVAPGETCANQVGLNECGDTAHCTASLKCSCYPGFEFMKGQPCGRVVGAQCGGGFGKCVINTDCTDGKCKCKANFSLVDGKFCSGASAALASVLLMAAALVASRWM